MGTLRAIRRTCGWWPFWVLPLLIVVAALASCNKDRPAPGVVSPQAPTVDRIAKEMGAPLNTIKTESRAAAKLAPQVTPHTDRIDDAASRLYSLQAQLEDAHKLIAGAEQECAELRQKLETAEKERDKAREEKNTALSWVLRGLVVIGVVGAPLALILARNGPLAVVCGLVAAGAVVTDVFLGVVQEYRLWIAGGLGLLLLGGAAWFLIANRRVITDLVRSGEQYKVRLPQEVKEQVNTSLLTIQAPRTRKIVKQVRDALKPKPLKPPT